MVNRISNLNEAGKLVALQGKLKELPLEEVLREIYHHLMTENEEKQERIKNLIDKTRILETELKKSDEQSKALKKEIEEGKRQHEGSRQLINKLLEDIKRYQNDIEWYKRTYERRSFLGTLKEKLKRK